MAVVQLSKNHPQRDIKIVVLGYIYIVMSVIVTLSIFFDNVYAAKTGK